MSGTGARHARIDDDQPSSPGVWRWVVAVVAVFTLGFVLPHGWAPASGSNSPPASAQSLPAALAGRADVVRGTKLRINGTDPSLSLVAPTDAFDRPDGSSLGRSSVGTWRSLIGQWQISSGQAAAVSPPSGPRLAVVQGPGGGVIAQVRLAAPADQSGLAFGVTDRTHFFALTVTATSQIELVEVAGERTPPPVVLGRVAMQPDMTLGVRIFGPSATLLVNGKVIATHPIGAVGHGLGLYLGGHADTSFARFDDFVVQPLS